MLQREQTVDSVKFNKIKLCNTGNEKYKIGK